MLSRHPPFSRSSFRAAPQTFRSLDKKALRSRGISHPEEKEGPAHLHSSGSGGGGGGGSTRAPYASSSRKGGGGLPAVLFEREELKALLGEYRGFGMFSLIRALLFRDWRHAGLALVSLLLLVGQWAGPFGFIAFKLRMLELDDCPG